MRKIVLLVSCLALLACGGQETAEQKPVPAQQQEAKDGKDIPTPVVNTEGETQYLNAEDLEKLGKEKKEAIQQDSPLGEENDPVADLQKQLESKKK